MVLTSEEHAARKLERLHQRAAAILRGERPSLPLEDAEEQRALAEALAARVELRLPKLAETFALAPTEADVVLCLLAAESDPFFRLLVRATQRDAGRPCLEMGTIADLLGLSLRQFPELKRLFGPRAPLFRWAIVEGDEANQGVPLISQKFRLDPRVVGYLLGEDGLPDGIALVDADAVSARAQPPSALVERMQRARSTREPLVVELVGRSLAECKGFLYRLGLALSAPVVTLDVAGTELDKLAHRLAALRRECRLAGAIPALLNWHLIGAPTQILPREPDAPGAAPKRQLPSSFARWLDDADEALLLVGEEHEPFIGQHARALVTAEVPFPTPLERAQLMERALEERHLAPASDVDLPSVMRRFALDAALIQLAARSVREAATSRDASTETALHSEIVAACRQQVRHDLKSVAERVEHSHKWEDLVIPVDVYYSLREMIAFVRHAPKVYDEWGFGGRHSLAQGVSALFAGPPGTGKTMCASVMARELDMELFRVDLSRVVSKWIGETEKNLSKVFDEAQLSNAIILFDEADSLFAKRTEVKSSVDRYANLEVNFLLQRMEAFGGVTILTTNFEDTIDTAFKRRLTFKMRFEKPDSEARAALWERMFPASCALADDVDFRQLGEIYEMSGGNIRSAAVRAAFLAAEAGSHISMALCKKAAEREAREMGLLIRSEAAPMEQPPSDGEADQPRPPGESGKASPRLVPITRPRR